MSAAAISKRDRDEGGVMNHIMHAVDQQTKYDCIFTRTRTHQARDATRAPLWAIFVLVLEESTMDESQQGDSSEQRKDDSGLCV